MRFKIIFTLLIILLVAGCGFTGNTVKEEPIKLGTIAPMTGPLAFFGEWMLEGAQMAVDEINAEGGINGRPVQLIVEDTVCQPQPTIMAMSKLSEIDKVDAFVGPFCGSPVHVAAEFAQANKKIVLTPNTNFGKLSDFLFTTDLEIQKESEFLAKHLIKNNITKAGVMFLNNDWGVSHKNHFTKKFTEFGGTLTGVEAFDFSVTDYRTIIAKVTRNESQAIFIAFSDPATAVNQIREMGLDIQIVGQRGAENPTLINVAGKNAEGMILSVVGEMQEGKLTESQVEFQKRFEERFNESLSHTSANTFDAVNLFARAMEQCGNSDAECMRQSILTAEFDGASGHVKMNQEINGLDRSVLMKTVKNGEFVLLE
ncbi:MAG: penicillin-binding protein activator [Nanoarchaeota archaeon]|nr:penicillin-binding protein activator [Nanoarchaeota archaeon]